MKRSGAGYFLFLFTVYFAGGLFLASISKYIGLDETVKRFFARMASPTAGHFYYPSSPSMPRDGITVFSLDDRDLGAYKISYPAPYGFHANRLKNIAAYRPRAIFIDFWFVDERDDQQVGELADALCSIRSSGVRVYLGSISYLGSQFGIRSVLRDLMTRQTWVASENSRQACATEVSVAKQTDNLDRLTWEYAMFSPAQAAGQQGLPTAAAQIYRDLYPGRLSVEQTEKLALVWGTDPHPLNEEWMRDPNTGAAYCRSAWHRVEALPVPGVIKQGLANDLDKPLCPYHLVLPLRALRELNRENHPWQTSLEEVITDKVIFYGSSLQSVDDLVYSPVHGRLPGVLMHAMALDNLMDAGAAYPKASEFDLMRLNSLGTLFPLGAVAFLSLFAASRRFLLFNPTVASRTLPRVIRTRLFEKYTLKARLASAASRGGRMQLTGRAGGHGLAVKPLFRGLGRKLKKFLFKTLYSLALLLVVAWVGAQLHLGPLTWIEFALLPLMFDFLKTGQTWIEHLEDVLFEFQPIRPPRPVEGEAA